ARLPEGPSSASLPNQGCCGSDGIRTRTFQLDRLMCSRYTTDPCRAYWFKLRSTSPLITINKACFPNLGSEAPDLAAAILKPCETADFCHARVGPRNDNPKEYLYKFLKSAIVNRKSSIPQRLPRLQRELNPFLCLPLPTQRFESFPLQIQDVLLTHRRARGHIPSAQHFGDLRCQLHFVFRDVVALPH